MTYKTLMVHMTLGQSDSGLLQIAADLAERFHAGAIGLVAAQPFPIVYGEGYISTEIIEDDRVALAKDIASAESRFRSALQNRATQLEWRSTITSMPLADYIVTEARSVDVILTALDTDASLFDGSRRVNLGDLVLKAGRPVLIVPSTRNRLTLENAVVGWKDTREARRAITDALPLLKLASQVTLVQIAREDELGTARDGLQQVCLWLGRHGIAATSHALATKGDEAAQLSSFADDQAADLIVAGAYGHSRLREWILGGVTHDLLLRADRCSLVSH